MPDVMTLICHAKNAVLLELDEVYAEAEKTGWTLELKRREAQLNWDLAALDNAI